MTLSASSCIPVIYIQSHWTPLFSQNVQNENPKSWKDYCMAVNAGGLSLGVTTRGYQVREPWNLSPTCFNSRHRSTVRLMHLKGNILNHRGGAFKWVAGARIWSLATDTFQWCDVENTATVWIFHSLIIHGLPEKEAGTKGRESPLPGD